MKGGECALSARKSLIPVSARPSRQLMPCPRNCAVSQASPHFPRRIWGEMNKEVRYFVRALP